MERRIHYIDGLRALAVVLVVIDHIAWHAAAARPGAASFLEAVQAPPLYHALLEGAHGVDIFFVLSGFCLSYPFLLELRNAARIDFDLARYLARRIVRIVPPYYCALALFGLPRIAAHYATWSDLLGQAFFLRSDTSVINEAFWTLAVEFRWYLLFPLALWLWIRSPKLFWTILAGSAALFYAVPPQFTDLATLPAFMLGIVAADLQIHQRAARRWALPLLAILIPGAVLAESGFHWIYQIEGQLPMQQTQLTWQLAAFAFVVACGYLRPVSAFFSNRCAIAIGIASYSIYLTHVAAVGAIESLLRSVNPILTAAAAFAAAILLGFAFWRYFERPFVETRLKLILVNRLTLRHLKYPYQEAPADVT